jgi:hypothetical protein
MSATFGIVFYSTSSHWPDILKGPSAAASRQHVSDIYHFVERMRSTTMPMSAENDPAGSNSSKAMNEYSQAHAWPEAAE